MTHPHLLSAFEATAASLNAASPLRSLFMRIAAHDASVTSLDLSDSLRQEFIRWPVPRQAAALALVIGNAHVTRVNLSGLSLTDAVVSALAAALDSEAGGRLEVLNLERNDLREPGLLALVSALQANVTLRELRLTGQRTAVSTTVEMALAEMLDVGGASALIKLGLPLRNDAARRMANAAIFRNTDRQRQLRAASARSLNAGIVPAGGCISDGGASAPIAAPPLATSAASTAHATTATAAVANSVSKATALERARASSGRVSPRHAAAAVSDELIGAASGRGAPPAQLWPPPHPSSGAKSSHRASPATSFKLSPQLSPPGMVGSHGPLPPAASASGILPLSNPRGTAGRPAAPSGAGSVVGCPLPGGGRSPVACADAPPPSGRIRIEVAPTPMPPARPPGTGVALPEAGDRRAAGCLGLCALFGCGRKHAKRAPVSPVQPSVGLGVDSGGGGGGFQTPGHTPPPPSSGSSTASSTSSSSAATGGAAGTGARVSPPPTAHTGAGGTPMDTSVAVAAAAAAALSPKSLKPTGRSGGNLLTLNPRSSSGSAALRDDASTPARTRPTASRLPSPFNFFRRTPPARPVTPPAPASPRAWTPRTWTPRGTALALPTHPHALGAPGTQRADTLRSMSSFDPTRLSAAEMTEEQRAAVTAFGELLAAKEAADVLHAHAALLCALQIDLPGRRGSSVPAADAHASPLLPQLTEALTPLLPHRSRQLLAQLSSRAARLQYAAADVDAHGQPLPSTAARRRAVIIGAGPIGLRCAIELAFLGLRVEVLESRERFGRLQVLH